MDTPQISLSENLQRLIRYMQQNNCESAHRRAAFIDSLITHIVTETRPLGLEPEDKANLIEMLSLMKLEYLTFIPDWTLKLEL